MPLFDTARFTRNLESLYRDNAGGGMSDPASLSAPIRLSVAAPAYNEAEGIAAVVAEWHDFLAADRLWRISRS